MGPQEGKRPIARRVRAGPGQAKPGWSRRDSSGGGARAGTGARPQKPGPGPYTLSPSLTHPRLPPERNRPDQRDDGTLGPERPREDRWMGEGAGPSGRCGRQVGEEARSRGAAGQSGPGRTAEYPTPSLHKGRLPETSPPICTQTHAQQ